MLVGWLVVARVVNLVVGKVDRSVAMLADEWAGLRVALKVELKAEQLVAEKAVQMVAEMVGLLV